MHREPCPSLGRALALSGVAAAPEATAMNSEEQTLDFSVLDEIGAPYRHFEAGEKIFLEDDAADAMYMVRSGRVDVITYGTVLENVRPGGIFGEMALIDDGVRCAAAMAADKRRMFIFKRKEFPQGSRIPDL